MKKIICILLALSMLLAFAGCGGNIGNDETSNSTTEAAPAELTGTLEEIASEIYSHTTKVEMDLSEPMEIDLTDEYAVSSFLGVSASIGSIERAVVSEPPISAIAYSMCLVKAKDGTDIEALKKEILEGVNYRKWLCVAAEKILVASCGNVIMMVMASEETVDDVYNAFNTVSNGAAANPLTRAGEIQEEISLEDEILADPNAPAAMPDDDIILG